MYNNAVEESDNVHCTNTLSLRMNKLNTNKECRTIYRTNFLDKYVTKTNCIIRNPTETCIANTMPSDHLQRGSA